MMAVQAMGSIEKYCNKAGFEVTIHGYNFGEVELGEEAGAFL